jgi:hypothetical protein
MLLDVVIRERRVRVIQGMCEWISWLKSCSVVDGSTKPSQEYGVDSRRLLEYVIVI